MKVSQSILAMSAALALGGCAATNSGTSTQRYVLGESASLCFDEDARAASALLNRDNILDVTPLYSSYSSHGSPTSRLAGATIEVRGVPGLEADRLQNIIECHRQAVARGAVAASSSDPYVLADDEMRVSIEAGERGGALIKLSCRQVADARDVLTRASALIGRSSPYALR
jgi:hypothetical protein